MTGVLDGVPIAIGQECRESHIDPDMFASGNMLYASFSSNSKLAEIAVSPLDQANAFDLFCGKRCNLLLLVANQPQATDPAAIRESEMLAIGLHLPASLLVFH